MYPQHFGAAGSGNNRGPPPPFQSPPPHFNPNFFQNPNFYPPNPNLPIQSSNFTYQPPFQTPPPNYPPHNPSFPVRNPSFRPGPPMPSEGLEKVDRAVAKARLDLLAAGECASAWKVSQAALLILQSDSWESVGFQMQQIPSLHRLLVTEGKINAFIHCFVGVRRMTSLYDLEVGICENEGVARFEDLEMGPLVKYPLVVHYFSVSSDVKQVFKITTEEILSYLSELMNTSTANKFSPDELLDFIAMKRKVDGRDKLSVRIQNLGMYIAMIQKSLQSQTNSVDKCLEEIRRKSLNFKEKRPLFASQKMQMDQQFKSISKRFGSFGKHIRFASSSSEDDSDNNEEESAQKSQQQTVNPGSVDRVSNCPYPSAKEERTRLGLNSENDPSPSSATANSTEPASRPCKRKRKSENISNSSSGSHKFPKSENAESDFLLGSAVERDRIGFSIPDESIRMFLTTWKDASRANSVDEVLERMLNLYQLKKRKKIKQIFTSYPCIGLLNVAIKSMKSGMSDSIYDTFQNFGQKEVSNTTSEKHTGCISIDVEPSEKNDLISKKIAVTIEEILLKVSTYFEQDRDIIRNSKLPLERIFNFLRKLCKLEHWLSEQFSVREFSSLGYGDFFTFLEKQVSQLGQALQDCIMTGDPSEKSSLEASIHQDQLSVLLSQANLEWENDVLINEKIYQLLMWQFPSVCFKLKENGSIEDIKEIIMKNKNNSLSKGLLFSAPFFKKIGQKEGKFGSVTKKDAIELLLRAPMLIDLESWSHWDLIYSPSLGPLIRWLLNEVNNKELLCFFTRSGKILRIDHTATIDSFLEAFLQDSFFQVALQLASLFCLYGGEQNVPLSLLKCHAQKGFEVLVKDYSEMEENRDHIFDKRNTDSVKKSTQVASNFVLDCLHFLPVELWSFAADVLLSGFKSVVKDAASAILNECKRTEHRLMIHEIGLSLGILEWVNDYRNFCSSTESWSSSDESNHEFITQESSKRLLSSEDQMAVVSAGANELNEECKIIDIGKGKDASGGIVGNVSEVDGKNLSAPLLIESIRREEFGLNPNLSVTESYMLKKQHARLGRALHCLSQELYSQDSHFLLELIQNADDNVYPENVEPTLTFILLEGGIIVLNNENGFSAENIRALCDVGNSTKKGSNSGYIGKKGIGFKSVFRVSDAPEIHSNGFHIKFDITEGQIGFVLPTTVPPCDIQTFTKLASTDADEKIWNTCVVLPFRSKFSEGFSLENIISMFSDLHPSLLLFLHRLQCIKFRNTLNDSSVTMRKQILGDGIVKVSFGQEKMIWFVTSKKLQSSAIRQDVQTTEISVAFTLEEPSEGIYVPRLDPQPVFAFLPLRTYGLKFILQGDFVLPSSREEVDGDSPWNQWLLSEFPNLFVSAEESFCQIPCFSKDVGKGISSFMSFIPLIGEVHGFFSNLPRMIISKLRMSNCLLLDGENYVWVPPCKVIRNWDEQAQTLLPENLIKEHLGLGFLRKDIILSDSLARALGIEEYGPKTLIQIISSLCSKENGLKSMGFDWLSLWLNSIHQMSSSADSDLVDTLRKIPFVPLSDGKFSAVDDGTIWLYSDTFGTENEYRAEIFPKLYAKLRTVNQDLFTTSGGERLDASTVDNVMRMLRRIGVQKLSAHDIMKVHILPAISDMNNTENSTENSDLMTEYMPFVMFHLQSSCSSCKLEREFVISELRSKSIVLTNYGFKRIADVAIHFSKDFKNPIDVDKLIKNTDVEWYEIDKIYLNHPITKLFSNGVQKWRIFFQELGVSDFVRVDQIAKPVADIFHLLQNITWEKEMISSESTAVDWESSELARLLSLLSSTGDHSRCKYLLEILDTLWEHLFSDKVYGYCKINSSGENKPFKSSLMRVLQDSKWISSSIASNHLNFAKDVFHDCEAVRSILGFRAPYTAPKVKCEKLIKDIGFKTQVTLDDIFSVLEFWRTYKKTFTASLSQMGRFYAFISNEISTSKKLIMENLNKGPFIFVPDSSNPRFDEIVPGSFLAPEEVYWQDSTGSTDQMKSLQLGSGTQSPSSKMLCKIYPNLHDFFVKECGINEIPPLMSYFQILVQLSKVSVPSEAASTVLQVLVKLSEGYNSGLLSSEDFELFKQNLLNEEFTILPSALDKWVSLHNSFGLVCWCDDENLKKDFKNCDNIDFIYFGESRETLLAAVSPLIQKLGIPFLSEITTREAINYGIMDSSFKTSLVNWALPYAQRYIYNSYPNIYSELKLSGFDIINQMRILVFEKLYYKNVIKKAGIKPNKRHECPCLLQDNILYVTTESDSHSIFMELARMLLSGNPCYHLGMANFLHMITTMAESGSTDDQIEHFMLNSQKIPKLPDDESIWAVRSPPPSSDDDAAVIASSTSAIMDGITTRSKKKNVLTNTSWPPADWRTAPGFNYSRVNGFRTWPASGPQTSLNNDEQITEETYPTTTIEINTDWKIEEVPPGVVPTVTSTESQEDQTVRVSCDSNAEFETVDITPTTVTNQQQMIITGREGEFVGYKYFLGKYGAPLVKWVNEIRETGLPYDIMLGNSEENREYIEVKATKSPRKGWFNITLREWQFAVAKGDLFSIARIVLLGNNTSRVTIYKNPVRLCQSGQLQLALIIPKEQQKKDFSLV